MSPMGMYGAFLSHGMPIARSLEAWAELIVMPVVWSQNLIVLQRVGSCWFSAQDFDSSFAIPNDLRKRKNITYNILAGETLINVTLYRLPEMKKNGWGEHWDIHFDMLYIWTCVYVGFNGYIMICLYLSYVHNDENEWARLVSDD